MIAMKMFHLASTRLLFDTNNFFLNYLFYKKTTLEKYYKSFHVSSCSSKSFTLLTRPWLSSK
jgi:hypothetical protein